MKYIVFLFALIAGSAALAQDQFDESQHIYFDTIRGTFEATPIGVDDMDYIGLQYISHEDSMLMQDITGVVRRDLDFYADFRLVLIDSFYLKTYEIMELDLMGWLRLGATRLVRLEAEFPGPNMHVYWKLFDTNTKQQFAKGDLEYNRTMWRDLAHEIANEIVKTLTGDAGIFRTKIVYARSNSKGKELYMSDYDGANEEQLTKNGSINISPTFHPAKEEVYFTSYLDGEPHLYKVNIQTKQVTKIASFPGIVAAPAVAPDGNRLACVLTKDGNSELYILDLKGKVIKRLTNTPAIESAPTWSPDGRWLAFTSDRTGTPQIYLCDQEGQSVKRLTFEGKYNDSPKWSERGDRVTFVSRTQFGRFDLASIDTSGQGYRVMTEFGQNENPSFSPDGKHLIFSSTRLGKPDIYMADATGRNQRRITTSGNCTNPAWGPIRQ